MWFKFKLFLHVVIFVVTTTVAKRTPALTSVVDYSDQELEELTYSSRNNPEISGIVRSFQTLYQYYLPKLGSNLSNECRNDLLELGRAFLKPETLLNSNRWALKLVDSWGKEEDGLLSGNRRALGFFQECLHVVRNESGSFGRYCYMSIRNSDGGVSKDATQDEKTAVSSLPLPTLAAYSHYGTCIPSSCTELELEESVTQALVDAGLSKKAKARCQSLADPTVFDSSEIFGIVFFSFMFALLLGASIVDLLLDFTQFKHLRGHRIDYLLAFSVPSNMNKIFQIDIKPSKEVISCAHGIRFLSITWVILGHQYYYSIFAASNSYAEINQETSGFLLQVIANGDKAVDTFFFLSGLFLALNFFRTMRTSSRFAFVGYYVRRIIRLVPPIAIYVCFLATLSGFFVTGPSAVRYNEYVVGGCRKYWWIDWTFLSNFFFRFQQDIWPDTSVKITCIPQAWYISVDMQIFIFMPAILLPIFYWKSKGLFLFGFWTVLSLIIPAAIIGVTGVYPTSTLSFNLSKTIKTSQVLYMMPYCRASPYFVGMWTGYLLWKTDMKKVRLSAIQVVVGWTTASVAALTVIFVYYPYNHFEIPNNEMGLAASVIYGGLHRGVWGLCIAWLLLACHWGYGGMVNSFLSHPAFQPLSRLTFTIYIVSLPLQFALLHSTIRVPYYNNVNKIIETCGVLFLTGIGALLLTLISESPVLRIEKLLRRKPPRKPSSTTTTAT